jgi:hypothetical protein
MRASNARSRGSQLKTNGPHLKSRTIVKKELNDYTYFLGTAKQASEYEATTLFVINYIKQEFEYGSDTAMSLEELKEFEVSKNKPVLQMSTSEDLSIKILKERQYELEFKEEFSIFMKRKQSYENNKIKAYAIIWERCAKGMQVKIESRNDFEDKIKKNPIELLKAVRQHSPNYQEH